MAHTTLTTVEEIKSRLRIPSDQTDQDAAIDAIREAVEEDILALTGFTFLAGSKTDNFTDWQRGTTRFLTYRPALVLTLVEGKVYGSAASFNKLDGDIKNEFEGQILLVGYQDAYYDPRSGDASGMTGPWFRWREYTWPKVRVTYVVDPLGSDTNPIPKALMRAALEWTAFIMSKPAGAGPIQSVSIEKVSESYGQGSKGPMPGFVSALLARFMRELVAIQV